jgi:hypothetical protein
MKELMEATLILLLTFLTFGLTIFFAKRTKKKN